MRQLSGYIIVPPGEDSGVVRIPVTVINGAEEGPVLALIAGVHGYEYPPILAMARLAKNLDPANISGKVIIVHIANVPSFLNRTIYYNPYDWKNLNRVFPGKADGTNSERIAYQITKEIIDQCDYLIDNHCGDGNEDLMQYLYCTETGNANLDEGTRGLAINFNLKVIVHETGRTTDINNSMYVSNTALLRGKPAISIEAGLYFPLVSRGDHVQKDELVGYLTDYFGNTIQEVLAPYDGIILYIIATPPMSNGEPMVSIGRF